MANGETYHEITEHIGAWNKRQKGWRGEVNMISWSGADPKVDIRRWNEDHTKIGKGIVVTIEEARLIGEMLIRL